MNAGGRTTDVERALAIVAYVVMRHGEAYVPLLDRLEQEYQAEQTRTGHRDRASKILATLTKGVKNASAR